jgi:hypothetical protein
LCHEVNKMVSPKNVDSQITKKNPWY